MLSQIPVIVDMHWPTEQSTQFGQLSPPVCGQPTRRAHSATSTLEQRTVPLCIVPAQVDASPLNPLEDPDDEDPDEEDPDDEPLLDVPPASSPPPVGAEEHDNRMTRNGTQTRIGAPLLMSVRPRTTASPLISSV